MRRDDAEHFARAVGLIYVNADEPGIRRLRCGRGFTYRGPDGSSITRAHPARQRLDALAIPPAWTDVWVCVEPLGHLQAVGTDTAGRRQYRYHDQWEAHRRTWRFARLSEFARRLPALRARIEASLDPSTPTEDSVHAAAARILDVLGLRVGNRASVLAAETYGLTTLQVAHADIRRRKISLSFLGKGGAERDVSIVDGPVARILDAASDHDDEHLLSWRQGDQSGHVTGASLRAWLKDAADAPVTARMFRTWHASVRALDGLRQADWGPPTVSALNDVLDPIAVDLGHTRATCRTYYVHEAIERRFLEGTLAGYDARAEVEGLSVAEQRCLALVDEHAQAVGLRITPRAA